ncbi:NfeD family protein [Chloroflexota bacterium]
MLEEWFESLVTWFIDLNLKSPLFQMDSSWFQVDPWLIVLITVATAAFLVIAIIWGIRAHHHPIATGREELVGKTARVKTVMNPKGTVLIQGELWAAISEDGQAEPGDEVSITKVNHLKVWVTKSKETR